MDNLQNTSGAYIDNVVLDEQARNYTQTVDAIALVIPEAREFFPTAVSVQLAVLEDYIAYAKRELFQKGVQAPGIGFIFAQYGDAESDRKMNPAYANKIHVVLKAIDMGLLDASGTNGVNFSDNIPNQIGIKPLNYMNISPPKAPIVLL